MTFNCIFLQLQARHMGFIDKLKFLQKKPKKDVEVDMLDEELKENEMEPVQHIRKRE